MLRERIVRVDGGFASEVEYTNDDGVRVGYWAYGYYDPSLPYQGECRPELEAPCRRSGDHTLRWEKCDWDGVGDEDVGTCEQCGLRGFGFECEGCGKKRIAVWCECEGKEV